MNVTRRHLVAAGALALGGVALMPSSAAVAQSAADEGVAKAVEALRQATLRQQRGATRGAVTLPARQAAWPPRPAPFPAMGPGGGLRPIPGT